MMIAALATLIFTAGALLIALVFWHSLIPALPRIHALLRGGGAFTPQPILLARPSVRFEQAAPAVCRRPRYRAAA